VETQWAEPLSFNVIEQNMKTLSLLAGLMVCRSLSGECAPELPATADATAAIERDVDIGGRTLHLAMVA